ncbi:MAG: hypothetical protein FWD99_05895 [Oscillospiraceae bacterium]|nr:hypothetical protein [Oscillospiraceae bacterium]
MKIVGWILTIIGSNGLTGTLVAKNSIRYSVDHLAEHILEIIESLVAEIVGTEQGLIASLVGMLMDAFTDNLAEGLVGILGVDQGFVRMVDTLFYLSIGVLIIGLVVLAIGYIKGAKAQWQSTQQAVYPESGDQTGHTEYETPSSWKFCPHCGQKVE